MKCPDGFYFVGRSKASDSAKGRGGIAVYKNTSSSLKLNVILDDLIDCVVFEVCNSPIVIIALYIPPYNSTYFNDTYFNNLLLFMNHFKDRHVYVMGDLNSRTGTPNGQLEYNENPDTIINTHGRTLMKILEDNQGWNIVNGAKYNYRTYDSNFTFYRGDVQSQNDLCITNSIADMKEFHIWPKLVESDHCPCNMVISAKISPDLRMVEECARNFCKYDHYDINRRILKTINLAKVDTARLYEDLEILATELEEDLSNEMGNDYICNKLTNSVYRLCVKNYTKTDNQQNKLVDIPNYTTCSSQNLRAIAEANFECYQMHLIANYEQDKIQFYREKWLRYERLVAEKENEEHNTKVNKKWSKCSKDAKELWRMVDWKGAVQEDNQNELSFQEIYTFFTGIFQSDKTSKSPKIMEMKEEIEKYNVSIPITDMNIDIEEINTGCRYIGNGVGMDGLPPTIAKLLPLSIRNILVSLFQNVFTGKYPEMWENQLLFPAKKKGHTVSNPKLRGIALSMVFSRIYDDVIDRRFGMWYAPNLEQAARKGQGCVFQIFALLLLIDYAKTLKKTIFIGLLDFEKAYDFTNRAVLVKDLMGRGIGKGLVRAVFNMYSNTSYTPKISRQLVGSPIKTEFGVTQGRKSSGNLYAFAISDIPKCLHGDDSTKDFMDPYCIAQLADDTSLTSESLESKKNKFQKVIDCADDKHQHINTDKTKYMHMSSDPIRTPIILDDGRKIDAVELGAGYNFIGFKLTYSDDIRKLVESNLKSKMFNIAMFHAWLEYNETTPFFVKMKTLYGCLFASMLHSVEGWGDLSLIEKTLLATERKALKSCLGIKSGTQTDLIYHEIFRSDIIAVIKDRQFNFAEKIKKVGKDEALMKEIWDMCQVDNQPTSLRQYYENAGDKNSDRNKSERRLRIETSEQSMCVRYRGIVGLEHCSTLYDSCLDDRRRKTITRWRLFSHKLRIETGRYSRPFTERDQRVCKLCKVVEDEVHAIFDCDAHRLIRDKYKDILKLQDITIQQLLNPTSVNGAKNLALFLDEIEENMKELDMC